MCSSPMLTCKLKGRLHLPPIINQQTKLRPFEHEREQLIHYGHYATKVPIVSLLCVQQEQPVTKAKDNTVNYLAIQEFFPSEEKPQICIWCRQANDFNKAHVISRKLGANITLTKSVCQKCNSALGKLEEWILRNTPLGWARFFLHSQSNFNSKATSVPAYFWSTNILQWLVYSIGGPRDSRTIPPQLLLKQQGCQVIAENKPDEIVEVFMRAIREKNYIKRIDQVLPEDFAPRFLLDGERVLLIAHSSDEINGLQSIFDCMSQGLYSQASMQQIKPEDDGRVMQHFKFSRENWIRFCGKIAFEMLCLVEGAEFCRLDTFNMVRNYILKRPVVSSGKEIFFDRHGPLPQSSWFLRPNNIDMTVSQNAPMRGNALIGHADPGCHSILIFELSGWICASVSVSGFPPVFLFLGGPDVHLNSLYKIFYDAVDDKFSFFKLAHDPALPMFSLPIYGEEDFREIAETYRLKPIVP